MLVLRKSVDSDSACGWKSMSILKMLRLSLFVLALTFSSFQNSIAQLHQKVDSLQAKLKTSSSPLQQVDLLNELANTYYEIDHTRFTACPEYAQKARKLARKIGDQKGLADALHRLGRVAFLHLEPDSAFVHYHQSLKIAQSLNDKLLIAQAYNSLGLLHKNQNQLDSANWYIDTAYAIYKKNEIGLLAFDIISNKVRLRARDNDFLERSILLQEMLALAKQTKNNEKLLETYLEFGIASFSGNFKMGVDRLNQAIKLFDHTINKDQSMLGKLYLELSVLYRYMSKYSLHEKYLDLASEIITNGHFVSPQDIFIIHSSKAQILNKTGRLTLANEYYDKALKAIGDPKTVYTKILKGHLLAGKAKNLIDQGDLSKAQEYLTKLQTYKSWELIFFESQARFWMASGKYQMAIEEFDKTITGVTESSSHLEQDGVIANLHLIDLHLNISKAISRSYLMDGNDIDLDRVSYHLNKGHDIIKNRSRLSNRDTDLFNLSHLNSNFYAESISLLTKLYKKTNNPEVLEQAFLFSEKSKAQSLSKKLTTLYFRQTGAIAKQILEKETSLKRKIAICTNDVIRAKKSDDQYLNQLEQKLLSYKNSLDSLNNIINLENPKPKDIISKITSIEDIQKKITPKTLLIEYFIEDTTLHVFTVTSTSLNYHVATLTENSKNRIKQFSDLVSSPKPNAENEQVKFIQLSSDLYNTLIKQSLQNTSGKDKLIIVPDGLLRHIPFEVLLTNHESNSMAQLPYLLKKYSVSYANSASLLFNNQAVNNDQVNLKNCLAFSFNDSTALASAKPTDFRVVRKLGDDLPGSRKEIVKIAEMVDGTYYFGKEANERNFKKEANNYAILHLAIHGAVDIENPEDSKLHFTQTDDQFEDNLLYMHELAAMDLNAKMAVLSACNSGTGKLEGNEGIISFGRAFRAAGVKSVVASKWEVSDATSPIIMTYFYEALKKGVSKSEALREAKLRFLDNDSDVITASPYFWGSFYVEGSDEPIRFKKKNKSMTTIYTVVTCSLLLFVFFFFRKRASLLRQKIN